MQRKIFAVVFSALIGMVSSDALLADEDNFKARCIAEAEENGITETDEFAEYVEQCVADLIDGQSDTNPPTE